MEKEKFNQVFILTLLISGGILFLLGIFLKIDLIQYSGMGLLSAGMTIGLFEFIQSEILKEK